MTGIEPAFPIVKPAVDAATDVVSSDPIKQTLTHVWQGLVGDRIAAWQLKNAAKLQVKTQAAFDALGVEANLDRIPERYAVCWFESATKEDEDDIQELFAKLLAKAAAGDDDALDRRHIEILSKLTPSDAEVFTALNKSPNAAESYDKHLWQRHLLEDWLEKEIGGEPIKAMEHLVTVGILRTKFDVDSSILQSVIERLERREEFDHLPFFLTRDDLILNTEMIAFTTLGLSLKRALMDGN